MVYLPMSYVYGGRFTAQMTPLQEALRREIYVTPCARRQQQQRARPQCVVDTAAGVGMRRSRGARCATCAATWTSTPPTRACATSRLRRSSGAIVCVVCGFCVCVLVWALYACLGVCGRCGWCAVYVCSAVNDAACGALRLEPYTPAAVHDAAMKFTLSYIEAEDVQVRVCLCLRES
jgi:hypothetical protein